MAGFALDADGGERLTFGEITIVVRLSAESTGGAFTLLEESDPMADTPLHVHANEDEVFHILEGEHVITCGDDEFQAGPGATVFLPRGVPHAQRRVVPKRGRMLVMTSPAGFEGFFRELAEADASGELGPDAYASASEHYGITWLDG
jgi:mannose-6-phosphate isomerase-like protein (cupin superfamily)